MTTETTLAAPTVDTSSEGATARRPQSLREQQLEETERALVRLRTSSAVVRHLMALFSFSRRTAFARIAETRARWVSESSASDREAKRAEMRATLNEVIAEALDRRVPVRNPDGTPARDAAGNIVEHCSPDLQRALLACAQLRALDGLDAPVRLRVDTTGSSGVLVVAPPTSVEEWQRRFGARVGQVDGGVHEPAPLEGGS